jgi:hypothetical protein
MTYRGIMSNGVVILDGEKPLEGTVVQVTPLPDSNGIPSNLADDPAIGIWKDRTDLPEDAAEAAKVLGQRLMRRTDE